MNLLGCSPGDVKKMCELRSSEIVSLAESTMQIGGHTQRPRLEECNDNETGEINDEREPYWQYSVEC